jgi:hypothetical protein
MSAYHKVQGLRRLVSQIITLAAGDHDNGISDRHAINSGRALVERLAKRGFTFDDPRNGDPKYVRSIYTAAYWLLDHHEGITTNAEGQ